MHLKDKHLMCRARRMMGNVVCALKLLISPVKKCLYRALFSGENRDARPSASLSRTSLSCLGLLKSDGRLRICTSFLNCSHRAFCGRKKREVKHRHPFIGLFSSVEVLRIFCCRAQKIYSACCWLMMERCLVTYTAHRQWITLDKQSSSAL